jgi:hypothetical protein
MDATVPVSGCRQERSARTHPLGPPGDQPEMACLRLVVIGDILCADASLLVLLAEVMPRCGLLPLAEKPTAPQV